MPRGGGAGGGGYIPRFTFLLYLFAKINPSALDGVIPMNVKYSKGTLDVIAAQVLKAIAGQISEESIKTELNELGRTLYDSGKKSMDYDDDFMCGSIPFNIHHLNSGSLIFNTDEVEINPQPLPPSAGNYSSVLNLIAQCISNTTVATNLKKLAGNLTLQTAE